jgi:hypothetical protein
MTYIVPLPCQRALIASDAAIAANARSLLTPTRLALVIDTKIR